MGELVLVLIQKNIHILVDLGLTIVQAKVYCTLIERGTSKVKTISQVSKVSRPDVYRTLAKLQELGLIEKEITHPIMLRAIPIENVIEILLKRKKKNYDKLKSRTNFLLNNLKNKHVTNSSQEESQFVLVPSKEALIKRLKKAIDNAQKSIDVATSSRRFMYACYCFSEQLENAWKRNVSGRLIIEEPEKYEKEIFEKVWRKPLAHIRIGSTISPTIMAMYDNREVFIFIDPTAALKESPALWSNDSSVIVLAEHYFELSWFATNASKKM